MVINDEKRKLLVTISKLYYENGYSQNMIGEKLGLSRPYVSKLINEARECGIVEIKINDPFETEFEIEIKLKEKFNLKKAVISPVGKENQEEILERLAISVSKYLNSIIQDNDIVGVGWGKTLYACSRKMKVEKEVKNITVVQLCGAVSMIERNIYASEISKRLANAFNGRPYALPLPAVVDNKEVKDAIVQDKNIERVLEIGKRANIAIFTMGIFGYESALVRAGYLNRPDVDELFGKGAIGDVCSRIIDIEGNICDRELDHRTIGIELEDLMNKEYRIGVAAGKKKVKCIYGALKRGYANVLITDEETAKELLRIRESEKNG